MIYSQSVHDAANWFPCFQLSRIKLVGSLKTYLGSSYFAPATTFSSQHHPSWTTHTHTQPKKIRKNITV